jgi:hypothetical protein
MITAEKAAVSRLRRLAFSSAAALLAEHGGLAGLAASSAISSKYLARGGRNCVFNFSDNGTLGAG